MGSVDFAQIPLNAIANYRATDFSRYGHPKLPPVTYTPMHITDERRVHLLLARCVYLNILGAPCKAFFSRERVRTGRHRLTTFKLYG
jgi:hypothetical protein